MILLTVFIFNETFANIKTSDCPSISTVRATEFDDIATEWPRWMTIKWFMYQGKMWVIGFGFYNDADTPQKAIEYAKTHIQTIGLQEPNIIDGRCMYTNSVDYPIVFATAFTLH